jgi:hypothetical protein
MLLERKTIGVANEDGTPRASFPSSQSTGNLLDDKQIFDALNIVKEAVKPETIVRALGKPMLVAVAEQVRGSFLSYMETVTREHWNAATSTLSRLTSTGSHHLSVPIENGHLALPSNLDSDLSRLQKIDLSTLIIEMVSLYTFIL